MRQISVTVRCALDYGEEKRFWFNLEETAVTPNYCEDQRKCDTCVHCAESALAKLTEELKRQ